jgi:hypothetical protein
MPQGYFLRVKHEVGSLNSATELGNFPIAGKVTPGQVDCYGVRS